MPQNRYEELTMHLFAETLAEVKDTHEMLDALSALTSVWLSVYVTMWINSPGWCKNPADSPEVRKKLQRLALSRLDRLFMVVRSANPEITATATGGNVAPEELVMDLLERHFAKKTKP